MSVWREHAEVARCASESKRLLTSWEPSKGLKNCSRLWRQRVIWNTWDWGSYSTVSQLLSWNSLVKNDFNLPKDSWTPIRPMDTYGSLFNGFMSYFLSGSFATKIGVDLKQLLATTSTAANAAARARAGPWFNIMNAPWTHPNAFCELSQMPSFGTLDQEKAQKMLQGFIVECDYNASMFLTALHHLFVDCLHPAHCNGQDFTHTIDLAILPIWESIGRDDAAFKILSSRQVFSPRLQSSHWASVRFHIQTYSKLGTHSNILFKLNFTF